VNSVNNGPWGQALTAELIPDLERRYRMDAKPSGRFITGHSSGGWAALWLQVSYPKLFGGAWPTSPDPSDFHNFLGIDLYAQGANVYRKPDGSPWPLAQDKGQMLVSIEDYTRREVVVGAYGGQLASFEWVFSPRGADGLPVPLFDRTTGAVDASVLSYWKDHYDVAEGLRRHWPELKRDLDGKIHLTVGSADTFFLDGAAHLLEATMKGLGARTDFRYVEGRGHFDLYAVGDDPRGLYKTIAWEIVRDLGDVPDAVVFPCARGNGLYGAWKGFRDLLELGVIGRLPRMIACQPAGAATIEASLKTGAPVRLTPSPSVGVSINEEQASVRAVDAVRESGGAGVSVSDEAALAASRSLGAEGLWAEVSSAFALAGWIW